MNCCTLDNLMSEIAGRFPLSANCPPSWSSCACVRSSGRRVFRRLSWSRYPGPVGPGSRSGTCRARSV
eukprot:5074641-Alexandrium_andersonii.AAC.1